jgi:diguanylate cyclase (GGDEF)-like protein
VSRPPLVERRRTSTALAVYTAATIVVGFAVLAWATMTFPLRAPIGNPSLPATSLSQDMTGLLFWILFGLLGSIRTNALRRRGMLTFHLPFIVAAMTLGGPVAAGWVAAISTLEIRELREVPWFGVLANHALLPLAAVGGGLVVFAVQAVLPGEIQQPLAWLFAALVGGYAFASISVALSAITVGLRENLKPREAFATFSRAFRVTAPGEIVLAWVLAMTYAEIGWWAPVVCVVLVLLLWNANDEHELAREDPLTSLLNRKGFDERWATTLDRVRHGRQSATLVAVDLDGFKAVNDSLGHAAGDDVIRATADRLRGAVRYTDTVARPGGDEFLLLLSGIPDELSARSVAERVHARLCEPLVIGGRQVTIGASLGVVFLDAPPMGASALDLADHAMYEAKRGGGGISLARAAG